MNHEHRLSATCAPQSTCLCGPRGLGSKAREKHDNQTGRHTHQKARQRYPCAIQAAAGAWNGGGGGRFMSKLAAACPAGCPAGCLAERPQAPVQQGQAPKGLCTIEKCVRECMCVRACVCVLATCHLEEERDCTLPALTEDAPTFIQELNDLRPFGSSWNSN
eukprot:1134947-Pelagomonas_calceolata.AAC.6